MIAHYKERSKRFKQQTARNDTANATSKEFETNKTWMAPNVAQPNANNQTDHTHILRIIMVKINMHPLGAFDLFSNQETKPLEFRELKKIPVFYIEYTKHGASVRALVTIAAQQAVESIFTQVAKRGHLPFGELFRRLRTFFFHRNFNYLRILKGIARNTGKFGQQTYTTDRENNVGCVFVFLFLFLINNNYFKNCIRQFNTRTLTLTLTLIHYTRQTNQCFAFLQNRH